MNNPLISVIVPAYNVEKYIGRCLDSIINQTYKNIEIIIIDDGSNDNTPSIIRKYSKHFDFIIPLFQENQGVSRARLNGINKSRGEWIGFVDSDDEIEDDMYEVLLKKAIKYNADISHCGYQMIFNDNRINYFYNTKNIMIQNHLEGLRDLLEGTMVEPGLWNKLYKKDLFKVILEKNIGEGIKINEDLLVNYYLFKNSKKSVFYDVCKYHYIVRKDSASRSELNTNKIYDPIKVRKLINEDIDLNLKKISQRVYLRTCINVYNSLIFEKNRLYKSDKKKVRALILKNKKIFPLLNRKQKVLYFLICYFPFCYKYIYIIYNKYFLNDLYQ